MPDPKPIAGAATAYFRHSHADLILGKILEGPLHDGMDLFGLKLISLYVDQFAENDTSVELAKKHGVRLCKSIEEALTLGGDKLAVDGFISVGEHGKYPENEKGQILYPRRKFLEEAIKTFARVKRSVPVFSDKHLAVSWDDAKWMYDRSRELMFPFLAGSSLPVSWRKPNLVLPKDCEMADAVMLGYGPLEGYGFHALEGLQCMVERRKGGEVGVKAVQSLTGEEMWKACDRGKFSKTLLEETLRLSPRNAKGDYREITTKNKDAAVWLVEYLDGFKAAVAIMNGFIYEGEGGAFCFAGQLKGEDKPRSCQFYLQNDDPFGHFIELTKAIEKMMISGHAPYPVERTLLTTGVLDALMTSHHENGKRIETPHLKVEYKPTDWPPATGPIPRLINR
jgi:hypothetical protein